MMLIIHFSISSKKWGQFSLVIAAFSLLDFVASILRMQSWLTWAKVTFVTTLFNRIVLIPIWLLKLGNQLPGASKTFGNQESHQMESDSSQISSLVSTPLSPPSVDGEHSIS